MRHCTLSARIFVSATVAGSLREKAAVFLAAQQALRNAGLREARILDEGIQVRVIIYRPTDDTQSTRDQRAAQSSQHVDVPQELSATESQVYSALAQKPLRSPIS